MTTVLVTTSRRYVGYSSDTKPDDSDLPAGSTYYEQDTGDLYRFLRGNWSRESPAETTALVEQNRLLEGGLEALTTEVQNLRRALVLSGAAFDLDAG